MPTDKLVNNWHTCICSVVLLFGVGCSTVAEGGEPTESASSAGSSGAASSGCEGTDCGGGLVGKWEGTYTCRQGKTGMTLEISETGDDATAIFSFYPSRSNTGTASGRFELEGTVDPRGSLDLNPSGWIDQPSGYSMVGVEGKTTSDGGTLTGRITGADGCSTFRVERVASSESDTKRAESGGTGGDDAASAGSPPEELACGDGYYRKRDPDDQFRLFYCDVGPNVAREGFTDTDKTSVARSYLREYMKSEGVNMPERWRAGYVRLCATELAARDSYYPNMTLTCLWHTEHLDREKLFEQESWMSEPKRKAVRRKLDEDVDIIRRIADEKFSRDQAEREREVYYDLREEVWQNYVDHRERHAEYWEAVDAFEAGIEEGDVENCEEPLREKLAAWVNAGGSSARSDVVGRFTDSVGYALTESLARCHWFHDRTMRAGGYLQLLEDARRKVTFGERLYYAQLAELQKDAEKKEKMPHLEGKELLELEPDDLSPPRLPEGDEATQKWRREDRELRDDVNVKGDEVARVAETGAGVELRFPEHDIRVPVKECEKTDRVDRITVTGEVIYERECETVGYEDATKQLPSVTLDDDYGIAAGDWVEGVYPTSASDDRTMVFIAAESDADDARVKRVLDIQVD